MGTPVSPKVSRHRGFPNGWTKVFDKLSGAIARLGTVWGFSRPDRALDPVCELLIHRIATEVKVVPTLKGLMRQGEISDKPVVQVPQNCLCIVPRAFPVNVGTYGLAPCVGLAMVFDNYVVVAHIDTVAATTENIAAEATTIVQRIANLVANLGPVRKVAVFSPSGYTGFAALSLVVNQLNGSAVLSARLEQQYGVGVLRSRFSGCIVDAESGTIRACADDTQVSSAPMRTNLTVGQAHGGASLHFVRT